MHKTIKSFIQVNKEHLHETAISATQNTTHLLNEVNKPLHSTTVRGQGHNQILLPSFLFALALKHL